MCLYVSVEVTAVFHFPFQACEGPIDVIQRLSYEHAVRHMYRFKG